MMFTEYLEGRDGRFDHRNVARSEDNAEDSKDIRGIQREVPRGLLDQSGEDLECNLDISTPSVSHRRAQQDLSLYNFLTYPIRWRHTSLAVFFSRNAPTFWTLLRRVVA